MKNEKEVMEKKKDSPYKIINGRSDLGFICPKLASSRVL